MRYYAKLSNYDEINQISSLFLLAVIASVTAGCGADLSSSLDSLSERSLNTAPVVMTGINISSQENIAVVTTISAHDKENSNLAFEIVGGVDADHFHINRSTGELRFREAPDFKSPQDNNANNTYVVVVSTSDGTNATRQTFAISVTDYSISVEVPPGYVKTLKLTWPAVEGVKYYQLYFRPDRLGDYRPVGGATTAAHMSVTIPVHFTDWINSRYLVEGYNDQGRMFRSDPKDIQSQMLDSIGYIKASNTDAGDDFGSSVALSADGQTLVVGAPGEESAATGIDGDQGDNSAFRAGSVYVFTRNDMEWSQQAYIKASNTDGAYYDDGSYFSGDRFGVSLAISADGQTVAVGASGECSAAIGIDGDQEDDSACEAGAVYVYSRTGTEWRQQAYVKASNTAAGDNFGCCVGLSADGQTLVVGAPGEDSAATGVDNNQADNSAIDAGAVYVYKRVGLEWRQKAYIKASNSEGASENYDGTGDRFGSSVALSADGVTLVVGAPNEDSGAVGINSDQSDNSEEDSGAAYVFVDTGTEWRQQAYIKSSNTEGTYLDEYEYVSSGDGFGSSVALSANGQTLVIGAPGEDSDATGIDGDQGNNSVHESGAVYVFMRTGVHWEQQAYIKASNTYSDDSFGSSVTLSADGQTLAVGAPKESSAWMGVEGDPYEDPSGDSYNGNDSSYYAGAVYLFTRLDSEWAQRRFIKASNTGGGRFEGERDESYRLIGDYFGSSVALNAERETVVVGAPGEASHATGVDGDQHDNSTSDAGAVYLY